MPKAYRLFKVAKELNVGTDSIVNFLKDKGVDIDNRPNAKITAEWHDELLKQFSSDRKMKQRAEELAEKRQEERQRAISQEQERRQEEEDARVAAEKAAEKAAALSESTQTESTPSATPDASEPPSEEPVKEAAQAESPVAKAADEQSPTAEAEPDKEDAGSGLKVLGKIDLNQFKRPARKSKAKEEEKPKAKAKKEKAPEAPTPRQKPVEAKKTQPEETPAKDSGKKQASPEPVSEKAPPKADKEKSAPPKEKKEEAPQPTAKAEAGKATAKSEKDTEKTAQPAEGEASQQQKETKEGGKIIRAGGNAPQLSGLKVVGKIELPGSKKKTSDNKSGSSSSDDNKKRRRRKRRRKKVAGDQTAKGGSGSKTKGGSRGGKKEKPSREQVDKSIRSTLNQMQRGTSRNRQRTRRAKRDLVARRREAAEELAEQESQVIEVTEFITTSEFANLIDVSVTDLIAACFQLGMMVTINQRLDKELLEVLGDEFGYEINLVDAQDQDFDEEIEEEDDPADLEPRSPIITVMGHVDHGKTTLLDSLRDANVAEGEAGGITQHIGAYNVSTENGKSITFLDTPGHEAFTAMRARGAQVTDVVIIVIAADDAVMPQTREAINHAQAANVPMVFAFNKIDKAGADPERIKGQLSEMNILVEDWGGEYQSQEISAKTGQNVDDLLEKVLLQAELLDLKANPDRGASGAIIESRLDRGRGNVATLLVQNGTLREGDPMVAGIFYGKVRAMIDQKGSRIKEASPATPVQILGLNGQPNAGDRFVVYSSESKAKEIAQKRQELVREQTFRQRTRLTLDEFAQNLDRGDLNLIIKGDVDGSVEALAGSLLKLSNKEVQVKIIHKAVGGITPSDVDLASASEAIILAFNTRPSQQARELAEREEVDIRTYSVIYRAIDDVRAALEGMLAPDIKEEITANIDVREIFKVAKVGTIAGCYVMSGKVSRDDKLRIIRDGVVIYTSKVASLRRFTDDVKEVRAGTECGIMVENYNDVKVGDQFEAFRTIEVARKLDDVEKA